MSGCSKRAISMLVYHHTVEAIKCVLRMPFLYIVNDFITCGFAMNVLFPFVKSV